MESRPQRPIAVALLCSSVLHTLTLVALVHWFPAAEEGGTPSFPNLSIELSGESSVLEVAEAPRQLAEPEPLAEDAAPTDNKPDSTIKAPPPGPKDWRLPDLPDITEKLHLNPVPVLHEEYDVSLATLAPGQPLSPQQQDFLQANLNQWQRELPDWTEQDEPLRLQDGGREYQVSVQRSPPVSATDLERLVLNVSTEIDGQRWSTRVPIKRMAFSHFAQVVDRWSPDVSLSGDRILGRFHSNSKLLVDTRPGAGPEVTGLTTVSGPVSMSEFGRRKDVFTGGLETRSRRIPLPAEPFPWQELPVAKQQVHFIDEDARLVFAAEGGYRWYSLAQPELEYFVAASAEPWLVIAREGVSLKVEGVVRGSVLVYSPRRITVTGDLLYARDPKLQDDSPDYLGLVSDAYIDVAGPDITGPGDLSIFASIYARRQFRVRSYRSEQRAQLSVFGSVTAGTLSPTEPRFSTLVQFDPRLEARRPAYFPLTNRYAVDDWNPRWTLAGTGTYK